jgi:ABC-type nickel/cobalt efflux system permease component RcnA
LHHDLTKLIAAALSIAFLHTVLGPDHYLPFVAMARIGRWSTLRTVVVTLLCGVGHVGSSLVLGLIGIGCGTAIFKLNSIEHFRGQVAGWLLLGFGLAYTVWGIWRAIRNRPHTHLHVHDNGVVHSHGHSHQGEHLHVHSHEPSDRGGMTPWVLFTIFLFGPCEPVIPLLMYPAANGDTRGVAWVAVLFSLVTLVTMTTIVVALRAGVSLVPAAKLERYSHALAGFVIVSCGVAVKAGM